MKKKNTNSLLWVLFVMSVCFSLQSYSQNCSAFYSYSASSETVSFSNLSQASNAHYYWNFGDGQTSYYTHPVHVYPGGGKYFVTLYTRDTISGCEQYYYNWIICSKTTTDGCTPFISDSVYTLNGQTYIDLMRSTSTCSNYGNDYFIGPWSSNCTSVMGQTTTPICSDPGVYISSAWFSLNSHPVAECHKTSLNNFTANLTSPCSANFEWSIISESNQGQLGQRFLFRALNKSATSYKWIFWFNWPIDMGNGDTTSYFIGGWPNAPYMNAPFGIQLKTTGPNTCRDSVLQAIVVRRRSSTTEGQMVSGIIEQQSYFLKASIEPNPASDYMYITGLDESSMIHFDILNSIGEVIKSGASSKYNISTISAGIYFVNLKTKYGNRILKFIKE